MASHATRWRWKVQRIAGVPAPACAATHGESRRRHGAEPACRAWGRRGRGWRRLRSRPWWTGSSGSPTWCSCCCATSGRNRCARSRPRCPGTRPRRARRGARPSSATSGPCATAASRSRAVPIDGPEQVGYVIRPEDYYLPDLDLAPDEQAALNLAVAGVHLGDPSGRDALWRLGLPASAGARPVAELPALPGAARPARRAPGPGHGELRLPRRAPPRRSRPAPVPRRMVVPRRLRSRPRRAAHVPGGPHGRRRLRRRAPGSAVLPDGLRPRRRAPRCPVAIGEGALVTVDGARGRRAGRPRRSTRWGSPPWSAAPETGRWCCISR